MGAVGGPPIPGSGSTLQTMIFQPEQRRMGLAFSSTGAAAYTKNPEWIDWADIYPNHEPQSSPGEPVNPAELQLYPNPASSVLYVSSGNQFTDQLHVYDLSGRKLDVPFAQVANSLFSADLTTLQSGLYWIVKSPGEGMERASFLVLR